MKKLLFMILCLFLLGTAAYAKENETETQVPAEDVDDNAFLLKIWDESGLEISYLRFDFYLDEDKEEQYVGLVCSSPNEGEDFYRCPYDVTDPESLENLRVEISYGISDLSPEDAIIQVMMGKPAEEHPLLTLDFIPECAHIYDLKLVSDEKDGWLLEPVDARQAAPGKK